MKSLKGKLIAVILTLVIVSSLSTVTIGLIQGFNLTETVIHTQFESKLTAASNMLKLYLGEQFGSLSIAEDGKIVDKDAKPIDGRYDYIDKLSQSMDVVATVFAKTGNDYTRILTTIKDDKGERVIGTMLDDKAKAYEEVIKGNVYFGEADIVGKQYLTSYTPIFDNNKQIMGIYFVGVPVESVTNTVNDGRTSTIKFVALLSIAVLLIASVISYLLANSIAKPIKKITGVAHEIAGGNFDVNLSVNSRDEVGELAQSFNLTVKRLLNYQGYIDEISDVLMQIAKGNLTVELQRDYVGQFKKLKDNMEDLIGSLNFTLLQINESADQVASGSEQVASGAQALAQGTTEQASSIEELSASIAEISEQIKQNATNANNSNKKIGVVGIEINLSNKNMQSMILAMKDINNKSSEIGTIIKSIDDIAFQTNILALNAAVEAARAGSAGKGFAVVAGEVKNLANKSALAAKDITKLIEDSIKSIQNGTSIADETAKSLNNVVTGAMETTEIIKHISEASSEQANSIFQINQGVEQISEIIQTNSATAEESSAASEELSAQAESLKQLVAKFTLKD